MYKTLIESRFMDTEDLKKSFAIRLKALRIKKGLTQSDMAKIMKISQPGYAKYERGSNKTLPKDFVALAKALEVTPEYMLHGIERDDEGLINMLSEQYKKRAAMSKLIKYKDIGDSSIEAELVPILKANEEQDFDGDLYTFEMNHKRFAPFLRVGDKVTFNASLKPRGNSPVIYKYDGDTFIGTYSKTRDGYKIEALNNACEDVYKADIVGVIVQVIKMPDLTD